MNSVKSSHKKMWARMHSGLVELISEGFLENFPEINFLVTLIIEEAKLRNKYFFKHETFNKYCRLLNISPMFLLGFFQQAWDLEDTHIPWVPPTTESDEDDYWR